MVFVLRWDHKQTPNKIYGSEEAGGQGKEAGQWRWGNDGIEVIILD